MRRTVMRVAPATFMFALGLSATTCWARELIFTRPPFIAEGRAYVPAREFCEWLGAAVRWDDEAQTIHVTWRGQKQKWSARSGIVRVRGNTPYLGIRAFADAFGVTLGWRSWRPGDNAVDFWSHTMSIRAAIPVGWKPPRMPRGLSPDERQIWRLLTRVGEPENKGHRDVPGLRVVEKSRWDVRGLRVVERWASATLHPLNCITDDATVMLEKREGRWRVLGAGTDVFYQNRNYGIPARVWRALGLPY